MQKLSRRTQLKGMLGMAAMVGMPAIARAEDRPIPPEGIGQPHQAPLLQRHRRAPRQRADHVEPQPPLCRPHVQRRRHHSRRQRSAQSRSRWISSPPGNTRARTTCSRQTICCCSPTAPISSPCSPTATCAAISRTRSPTASPSAKTFRSGLSIHDISKPGEMREIAFLEMPGLRHQPAVVDGRALRLCLGAFRRLHRSHPVHRRPQRDHKARDRLEMVAARHEPRRRRAVERAEGQALRAASHDRRRQSAAMAPGATAASPFTTSPTRTAQSCCRTSTGRRPSPAARIRRCRCRGASSRSWPTRPTPRTAPKGCSRPSCSMCARRKIRCRSRRCRRRATATIAPRPARSARTICTRTGRARSRARTTIFATYNAAGVRVFDIKDQFAPKEIASWVPPTPAKLIDPRPNVALAAKTADIYVTPDGLIYVSDWNAGLHVLEYQG